MTRTSLFVLLVFVPLAFASAQEGFKGQPFVETTGTAELEIEPNEIYLNIRLREFEENKNKTALEKIDQDFLNALKAAGIDRKRLTLADAGSRLSNLGRRDKDAFRQKTYQLIVTGAPELEKLLEKLEPVKVDNVTIVRVHHSDFEKIKLDLKVKALLAAKQKADVMLAAIGASTGKALVVREWEADPVQPYQTYAMANVRMDKVGEFEDQNTELSFKKIRIRVQVGAQFEIK